MHLSLRGRHIIVALTVVVLSGMAFGGCLGPAVGRERIHAMDVTAVIGADSTVAIREVIDYDFGPEDRRGIIRSIPSDGGAPTEIRVSSETAPDDVLVSVVGTNTEIRIGDPDTTIDGRHRYVISYVLPATIIGGTFALDAVGAEWQVPIEDATVTVLGATLTDPVCVSGPAGSTDPCDISREGGGYRVEESGLGSYEGITVSGQVATTSPSELPEDLPPFEGRDAGLRLTWAAIVFVLGAVTALVVFVVSRQMGRNEVAAGGATEAAFVPFGQETFGTPHEAPSEPAPGARLVADTDMHELAGLDFVPPGGIEPWQASVVTRETIDDRTIGAWFSGLAAHDVLVIDVQGELVRILPGPKATSADPATAAVLNQAMGGAGQIVLGSYNPTFAGAWQEVGQLIDGWVVGSQVFRRRPPRFGAAQKGCLASLTTLAVVAFAIGINVASDLTGGMRTAFAGVVLAVAIPGIVAMIAYRRLIRSLSAKGSAIALRTESFRRFLHDSEAQHVEWAWQNGLLREYSAWAVALGEVDAWNHAMAASAVPPVEQHATSSVLAPSVYSSSFSSTTTAPSSSGSGGGGGGGGSVGGGGGGGGGGSW